jgi:hypothetical protein
MNIDQTFPPKHVRNQSSPEYVLGMIRTFPAYIEITGGDYLGLRP